MTYICDVCGTDEGNVDEIEFIDGDRTVGVYILCESDECLARTDEVDRRRAEAWAESYLDDLRY
jgi:hypothetical protein